MSHVAEESLINHLFEQHKDMNSNLSASSHSLRIKMNKKMSFSIQGAFDEIIAHVISILHMPGLLRIEAAPDFTLNYLREEVSNRNFI